MLYRLYVKNIERTTLICEASSMKVLEALLNKIMQRTPSPSWKNDCNSYFCLVTPQGKKIQSTASNKQLGWFRIKQKMEKS